MGRTIEFNTKEVINLAMQTFWNKGLSTTLSDLEATTGLNRSSLYNTFGSKEKLFQLVMNCYLDFLNDLIKQYYGHLSFKDFLKTLLEDAATENFNGRGCFFYNCLSAANGLSSQSKKVLDAAYINMRRIFEERILLAQEHEELDVSINVSAYAGLLMMTVASLRAFNMAGFAKEDLKAVAATALIRLA
ncbi:MAG: hypothetical protein CTY33_07815 [Methylotenera sp.]|nr:MAG: hypothetical protein CTY33_07815 [Methylotenera sp.]